MDAIHFHPNEAAEAMLAVQGTPVAGAAPVTVAALRVAADRRDRPLEEVWVEALHWMGLVDAFVGALLARGVPLDPELDPPDGAPGFPDHFPPERLGPFTSQARSFRCRVLVDGHDAGSGCLIGPSLVLTAWHVIVAGAPEVPHKVEIRLADNSKQDVVSPPRFESRCGDDELRDRAPRRDEDVAGRNDVAVLLMRRPAATHLGHVRLPAAATEPESSGALVLVHFPGGQDRGLGFGKARRIPQLTARWGHTITTLGGSSGGACFDRTFELAGVHQGRRGRGGRFVPLARFLRELLPGVADDVAPARLWSLDGTATGALVIGRALLFEALAAAGADTGPVRGVRVKRTDILSGGTAGLAFTRDILRHLLDRRGPDQLLVRLPFDELVEDAVADIRDRVGEAGLPLPALTRAAGVDRGTAAPAATVRDRATRLAMAVDAAASAAGRTVWFFLDNPSVTVTDDLRLAVDGFVAAALTRPRLRLVITGFETLLLPGQEFQAPGEAMAGGAPGLVVEFIGGFQRRDVLDLLALAAQGLTGEPLERPAMDVIADRVLRPLTDVNGTYPDADLAAVARGLQEDVAAMAARGVR